MPEQIELPLTGPVYDRAVALVREAVTAALHAPGPAGLFSLEPILTEMANDRVVGGVTALLLVSLAADAALAAGALELDVDGAEEADEAAVRQGALALVEDLLEVLGAGVGPQPPDREATA